MRAWGNVPTEALPTCVYGVCASTCVCVCVRERERGSEREGERERERET